MASFSAELHVAGQIFPVLSFDYGVHQAIDSRGRVTTKVRSGPVRLRLPMLDGDLLLAWAADPHKRLLAHLLLRDADAGTVLETLTLPAAYCVSYSETFVAGSLTDGAYVCDLTLADPSGFTLTAGGPGAYVPAPARDHGSPAGAVAATLAATALAAGNAAVAGSQLLAGSPAHQAARWAAYQAAHVGDPNGWSQARWEKQYAVNMKNGTQGIARESEYKLAMNATSETLKTSLTFRQIDLYKADELYCGQLKTGKMSLNKQAKLYDIPKDTELVQTGFEVEYILEKGASKPFLEALTKAGVTYKIGPQIP